MQGMQRYLDLFLSEAREHLNAAYELESRVTEANPESQPVDDLLRHTHSIKGMAATLGFGSMVSLTHALEDELAAFCGTDAALAFATGYMANVGVIPALANDGDVVISDSLSHASIIDGCRTARARKDDCADSVIRGTS